ncbi:MAG: tyrosine-type recombinase/integrase [Tepidisphaeraceae bacterium]|jgi:integrase
MKLRRVLTTETLPEGRKLKKRSVKWYAVFCDFNGWLRRLPLFEDRRASDAMARIVDRLNSLRSSNDTLPPDLARAVDEMPSPMLASLAKWGIVRPEKAATTKALADHVEDWRAALLAKGNTRDYVDLSANRVLRIVTGLKLTTVGDVSASRVQTFLAGLRQDRKDDKGNVHPGIGAASFNYYLRDARSFFRWMVRDGRAFESPLAHLQGVNARTDKRHDRRALAVDELRWLLDVTERGYTTTGPDGKPSQVVQVVERYGMSGADRAMLYRLAVETGLRSAELRSLTRGSFNLAGNTPTVAIAAAYGKNRRQDVLPLKPDTAAMLAKHLAGKMPTAPAFTMPRRDTIIDMMQADLTAARTAWIAAAGTQQERGERESGTFLAYKDDAGRCADFHALRHTFISNLAAGGVHPKTAQRLARHSTITLTMDRYTHLRREDLAGALEVLPDLSSTRRVAVATGTDGREDLSPYLSPGGEIRFNPIESSTIEMAHGASDESLGKSDENPAFSGGNESLSTLGLEPRTYGLSMPTSANVPKPGSAGLMVIAGFGILARRRRSNPPRGNLSYHLHRIR